MNEIEKRLDQLKSPLLAKLHETRDAVKLLLQEFISNFPTYTDHSVNHTWEVFRLAGSVMAPEELNFLSEDELYVLGMACLLHDIGMCVPIDKLEELGYKKNYEKYKADYPETQYADYLRDIHHELSADFIRRERLLLKIESPLNSDRYAEAIARVAMGHRKVNLQDLEIYKPNFSVKSGVREFVCLPYLACVLRIADELDVTNIRTPDLLVKYYLPENAISRQEFEKHLATTHIEFDYEKVIITAKPDKEPIYNAIKKQLDKIARVIEECQKVVRHISNTGSKTYKLRLDRLVQDIQPQGFVAKDIKFSLDTARIFETFIGKHLYETPYVAIREAVQNAIDSCRYRKILEDNYIPKIEIELEDGVLIITDNAVGMDEFIVASYFGKLGSSYYLQQQIKDKYNSIGQFGIGVFSYFLLGDCIEVETKSKNADGLHFKATQNPDDYFHFLAEYNGPDQGTRLKIHLNSEENAKLDRDLLTKQLRYYFRHIEFPLHVKVSNQQIQIESQSMELTMEEFVEPYLNYQHRGELKNLSINQIHFSNDEFVGSFGLLTHTQNKYFAPVRGNLMNVMGSNYQALVISQKGVFVKSQNIPIGGYLADNFFAKINFKNNVHLQINRSSFDDSESLNEALSLLLETFLLKILKDAPNLQLQERGMLVEGLCANMSARSIDFLTERASQLFESSIVVTFWLNKSESRLTYLDFVKEHSSFIEYYKDDAPPPSLAAYPQVYSGIYGETGVFYHLILSDNYHKEFVICDNQVHQRFNKSASSESIAFESIFYPLVDLINGNNYLMAIEEEKEGGVVIGKISFVLNPLHELSKYIINNEELIKKNPEADKIIRSLLHELKFRLKRHFDLPIVNELLSDFNAKMNTNFKVTDSDFYFYHVDEA
jgi:HD superfamily phosphodiesterase/ribosome-associated translation inhibitor RaiA